MAILLGQLDFLSKKVKELEKMYQRKERYTLSPPPTSVEVQRSIRVGK